MSDPVSVARSARENLRQGLAALQAPGIPAVVTQAAEPVAQAMGALHQIEASGGAGLAQHAPVALEAVRRALGMLQTQPAGDPAVAQALQAVAGSLSLVHQLSQAMATAATHLQQPSPAAQHQYAHAQQPPPQQAWGGTHVIPPTGAHAAQPTPHQSAQQPGYPQQAQPGYAAPAQQAYPPQAAQPAYVPPAHAYPPQAQPGYAQPGYAGAPAQVYPPNVYPPNVYPPNAAPPAQAPPVHAHHQQPLAQRPAAPPAPGQWQAPAHAAAPPAVAGGPRLNVEAELGAHSTTNFYKGLSGNDVIDSGGIFIATYQIPEIGQPLLIKVSLPGGYEFEAAGVVRWTRDAPHSARGAESPPGFGAQFTNISQEGRQLVYRYVRNREPLFHDDL